MARLEPLLGSLIACFSAAASDGTEAGGGPLSVEVEEIEGASRGILEGLSREGGRPILRFAGRTVPCERVIRVLLSPEIPVRRETLLVLSGGDDLFGGIVAGGRDTLTFSSFALDSLPIRLEAIRAILFRSRFPDDASCQSLRREILRSPPGRDVIHAADGGRIEGVIDGIDGLGVKIESGEMGVLEIAHARIRAIAIAPIEIRKEPPAGGLTAVLVFRDGSTLSGAPVELEGEGLRFEARALGPLSIPLRRLHAIEFRGGLCQYLSDLEPSAVEERTYFGPSLWPVRRDANVLGGPISIRGRRYRRGLGVHSYSKLTYRLDGEYARFQAAIGVDDVAQGDRFDSLLGNVVFRVIVDGEVRFDSGPVTTRDPARPIDVDLRGAREIALEVDFGDGFHARDRADWADARLIRAEGAAGGRP